jgi:hypothetical protein
MFFLNGTVLFACISALLFYSSSVMMSSNRYLDAELRGLRSTNTELELRQYLHDPNRCQGLVERLRERRSLETFIDLPGTLGHNTFKLTAERASDSVVPASLSAMDSHGASIASIKVFLTYGSDRSIASCNVVSPGTNQGR